MPAEQPSPPSRRERKKEETRQRISAAATMLFLTRGFEEVTVGEVAEAADVSKVTVFNHFPRKEDMLLDRGPEAMRMLAETIEGRADGETPLAALRRRLLELSVNGYPLGGFEDRYAAFWGLVAGSPALRARVRELGGEFEETLARLYAEADGLDPADAHLRAALTVAAMQSVYRQSIGRMFAGAKAAEVVPGHVERLNRAFDALERAFAGE